jgi:hypothetical protein
MSLTSLVTYFKEEIMEEITEKLMEKLQNMVNQKGKDALKKFQDTKIT